jgi:hypothetical protein
MNQFKSMNKPMWAMTILMTAIMAGCGGGSSSPPPPAQTLGEALGTTPNVSVSGQSGNGVKGTSYSVVPTRPNITVTGTAALNVSPVLTPPASGVTTSGSINVVNNSPTNAHVAATQTGTGTLSIVNNGGPLQAINTSSGMMTINSNATANVAVTNSSGKGNITVSATGSSAIACSYSDGLDHNVLMDGVTNTNCMTNVAAPAAGLGTSLGASTNPNINVTGTNAGNVTSVVNGGGFINVTNNGAHVAATQTGSGTINVVNNGVGGVLAATNSGTGTMTINSNATAAVAVTRTGNGDTTVNATGSTPLHLAFNGDGDVTYPVPATALALGSSLGSSLGASANITVSGTNAINVAPVLTGAGFIDVVNNGAGYVAATETGTGTITIVNNTGAAGVTATNNGSGKMTINNTATAAVTITKTGNGDTTVTSSGNGAITCTYVDAATRTVFGNAANPACAVAGVTAGLGSALGASVNPNITVTGTGALNGVTTTVNDATGVGSINVNQNGSGGVTVTETGTGTISIVNTGTAMLTATNNGNGAMTINNAATGAVTVTNTGNGSVIVNATGSDPITLTHNGDDDFVYTTPAIATAGNIAGGLGATTAAVLPVTLGTAGNFEILASTGISEAGVSTITGKIGTSPSTSSTIGVACAEFAGAPAANTSVYGIDTAYSLAGGGANAGCYATGDVTTAPAAVINMQNAYNYAADATLYPATATELNGGNLTNGEVFAPGVYKWSTAVTIPAAATITLTGTATDVWVFQVAGGVAEGAGAKVLMGGTALASNVFWQSAGVVAIGAGATLNGVVLSKTGITLSAGATVHGKLLAQTSVTLSGDTVAP